MNDCVFCRIIEGKIPAEKVYEDDQVLAFLDITPVNKGHTLVIPKDHVENIFEFSPASFAEVMEAVRKLSRVVKQASDADGINIIMNNDPAAGQVVFHAHVHIIPRYTDDGFRNWDGTTYAPDECHATGERIRATLP